jgi:hypothetical protein
MSESKVCVKCSKDLPIAEYSPLSTGKGFYKKCKACVSAAGAKGTKVKKEKKKDDVKDKEILLLLSNFDSAYNKIRKNYESKSMEKIAENRSELNVVLDKLSELCIN